MPDIKISRSMEEVIIIASSIIMASTIIPFAIFRYINGQHLVALVEILSVFIMSGIGLYVWKTRKIKYMTVLTSIFMLTGLVVFNYILSTSILFWIYPIIMTVYFINSLHISFTLVSLSIMALMPVLLREKSSIEVISIVVTLLICQLFGYLLSRKIKEQYSIMEELANKDGLTGASNRRALEDRINFLGDFSFRHKRKSESVSSIIMFDIDNFKAINDEYGHLEGDSILINLTKVVTNKIRGIDHLYRYGGEEFIIIANGADTLAATELAEKVRSTIELSDLSENISVTASFGVAEFRRLEKPQRWIERADQAMYRAKRAGKNRVFIANFDQTPTHTEDEEILSLATR